MLSDVVCPPGALASVLTRAESPTRIKLNRSLFSRAGRQLPPGCIRTKKPFALAELYDEGQGYRILR